MKLAGYETLLFIAAGSITTPFFTTSRLQIAIGVAIAFSMTFLFWQTIRKRRMYESGRAFRAGQIVVLPNIRLVKWYSLFKPSRFGHFAIIIRFGSALGPWRLALSDCEEARAFVAALRGYVANAVIQYG